MSRTPSNRNLNVLGIIPARGGSKGLPGKNIKLLAGKPLIAWTIEAAQASTCVNRLIVTTEDKSIAEVARTFGAEIPFMRPADLAQDNSPSLDAILHAIHWLASHENYRPQYILLLQPTSPLRSVEDIQSVIRIVQEQAADAVVSVTLTHYHPYWMKTICADNWLENFPVLGDIPTSRQLLPPVYALNGALYLVRREILLEQHTFHPMHTRPYIMPAERSLDIDTAWDFHLAELILKDQLTHESH